MNLDDKLMMVLFFCFTWLMIAFTHTAEAGPYVELGAGKNLNAFGHSYGLAWDDADAIGAHIAAGYTFHHNSKWSTSIHWTHTSQWNAGWPVNTASESTVDHIGVKVRYELWR